MLKKCNDASKMRKVLDALFRLLPGRPCCFSHSIRDNNYIDLSPLTAGHDTNRSYSFGSIIDQFSQQRFSKIGWATYCRSILFSTHINTTRHSLPGENTLCSFSSYSISTQSNSYSKVFSQDETSTLSSVITTCSPK